MSEIEIATQQYQEQSAKEFNEFKGRIKLELGDELFAMTTFEDTTYRAIARIKNYGIEIDWERPKKGKWNARQYWNSPKTVKYGYPLDYWDVLDCKWCNPHDDRLRQVVLNMIARVNVFCAEKHKSKQLQPYWYEKLHAYGFNFWLGAIAFGLGAIAILLSTIP